MVKRLTILLILTCAGFSAFAQQSWEGLATVSRFGRFPAGLYGASNLVAPNTLVSVRNLETGISERIIITDGVSEPGVFLVLSGEAASLLDISGSGATRVRLTTIVTDTAPINGRSEVPLHRDPDINPAAGVPLETELPPLLAQAVRAAGTDRPPETTQPTVETVPDEPETTQTVTETTTDTTTVADTTEPAEPDPTLPAETEPAQQPVEATLEEPQTPEQTETADLGQETPIQTEVAARPSQTGPRSGIAAGVARTQVGQAQESFERPETPLEAERPVGDEAEGIAVGEPSPPEEQVASVGIDGPDPVSPGIDTTAVVPNVPAETTEVTTADATVVAEASTVLSEGPNPIGDAISAAVNRIPPRDYFPAPVGEEGDLGFSAMVRPSARDDPEPRLAVASPPAVDAAPEETTPAIVTAPPAVDRPELAGLGPLRAVETPLPTTLALAALPPEDRPVVTDLRAGNAPEVSLTPGRLAEATAPARETPSADALLAVDSPDQRFTADVAQATVADADRPELADVGPARAPDDPTLSPNLAAAEFVPPPSPGADSVDMVSAPSQTIEAELAEALPADSEAADLADVGAPAGPADLPVEGRLAEASPGTEETPEGSLAGITPGAEAELAARAVAPDLRSEEPSVAVELSEVPEETEPVETGPDETLPEIARIPEDAILTLEPADFRPPEFPDPDEESIIDRETPDAEPEVVAALEAPTQPEDADRPAEVALVPETTTTAAVTTAPDERVVPGSLPVVSELADNNYYLQIGAYTVPATAQVAVDALGATYPMAVLPIESGGRTVYRVLVGPLEQDETGMLLLFLRSRGYRDTFIRSGTEL